MKKLSKPSIERYCRMFSYLERLQERGVEKVQSKELGELLGVTALTVRKDLSFLNREKNEARSYNVEQLKALIGGCLKFDRNRNACVVGLGRIGTALLAYGGFKQRGFTIVAGFEESINRLELIKTDVKLYPAYQLEDVVKREGIEVAMVSVPADAAAGVIGRLAAAGVTEIVNFAPVAVPAPEGVIVKNVDFTQMLRQVVAIREAAISGMVT